MEYHKEVFPYLNTNERLDDKIEKLWAYWTIQGEIDVNSSESGQFKER